MRYTTIIVIILTVSLSFKAKSQQTLDEKNGFNKFQLGASIKDIKKLVKVNKSSFKDGKYYERYFVNDIEEYKLFGYDLGSIQFIFYKERLLEIIVQLKDQEFSSANVSINDDITENIEKQYGKFVTFPLTSRDKANAVIRKDKIIGSKLELHRYIYALTRTGNFSSLIKGDTYSFISIPINEQINKEDNGGL
ncbi:hypothetical protein [Pedobacter frigiditerrae]|uniref:hypothetical protein n=1 Tax=Pedobacter frigiditerrae TaxID=2530452 RepID=UPI00292F74A6|nr:hypothetical protein [Pedobacter frigiditerrae]